MKDSLIKFERAIALNPGDAEAYCYRGNILAILRRFEEALVSYEQAISLNPDYALASYNLGLVLHRLQRYDDALVSLDRAISLKSDVASGYNNRGNILLKLRRYDDALVSYDRALSLDPDYDKAYYNRANVLKIINHYEEALNYFSKVISINPDFPYVYGSRLQCQLHICWWQDFDHRAKEVNDLVKRNKLASMPFSMLVIPSTPEILRICASLHVTDVYLPAAQPLWQGDRYNHNRIRVGYFSADFRDHAMSYLIAELIERHDRARFEIFAFSFCEENKSEIRVRLRNSFDRFFDVCKMGDQACAALVRNLEIDIAVDLMGFTKDARPGIFALRPAPIQVSYMGYPATMGAPFIDYIIADSVTIPSDQFKYYTEKVVQLPNSYWVSDSKRQIPETTSTRTSLGLPESGFVFCSFNNNYKITPDVFTIWMRLLTKVDRSVLWLLEDNAAVKRNLCHEAQERNIDPRRLIFAPRILMEDHLARHRHADLFLDTFYYNSHTTASDALWMGLPVVSRLGNTFPSRVASSLLNAIGLPELITNSNEEYESLAFSLATNPGALSAIKRKLAKNRSTYPLFNTSLFTQHIEAAYSAMWEHYQQGLAPEHISIAP